MFAMCERHFFAAVRKRSSTGFVEGALGSTPERKPFLVSFEGVPSTNMRMELLHNNGDAASGPCS